MLDIRPNEPLDDDALAQPVQDRADTGRLAFHDVPRNAPIAAFLLPFAGKKRHGSSDVLHIGHREGASRHIFGQTHRPHSESAQKSAAAVGRLERGNVRDLRIGGQRGVCLQREGEIRRSVRNADRLGTRRDGFIKGVKGFARRAAENVGLRIIGNRQAVILLRDHKPAAQSTACGAGQTGQKHENKHETI